MYKVAIDISIMSEARVYVHRKLFTAYSKYLKLLQKKEPSHQLTHQSSLSEALSSTKYGSVPEKCLFCSMIILTINLT